MQIDGHTRLAAVVAKPIKHSISPFIHNRAFSATRTNGVYLAWEIEEEDLAETVQNIRRYAMWGINLSMPYKQAVIPYLDDLSPAAQLIGAVNTVVNQDGRLIGHNTDGIGFFRSLPGHYAGKTMTILGGGGAAMAIIAQAILEGLEQVIIFKRQPLSPDFQAFIERIERLNKGKVLVEDFANQEKLQSHLLQSDLVVNATSIGMDGVSLPLSDQLTFSAETVVADVIYQPFETPFLGMATKQGCQTVNGLGMLLYQAAEAFELWTGQSMPTEEIWEELVARYNPL